MKKQWFRAVICAVLAVFCLMTAASAVEPRLAGISNFYTNLTISNYGVATCQASSKPTYLDYSATLSVSLQRSSTGTSSWTTAKTWEDTGTINVSVSEKYYVVSGYYYRLYCSVSVYDADGELIGYNTQISNVVYRG